ncbi:MAG TPA: HypC/HybG/HupF family hydrogenase formation chaperone [Candidatus Eisenbacteria bacterium]|nr:HypC/HybG/HupF family hydrogenase formation chaperone [Candidatus Eisenbacteria bacterium]
MNGTSAALDHRATHRMRISYPGRVAYLDAHWVLIDQNGHRRRASRILAPHLQAGDWVYVAAGSVIEQLGPLEAAQIVETLDAEVAAEASALIAQEAAQATAVRRVAHAAAMTGKPDRGLRPTLRIRPARQGHRAGGRQRRDQRCLHLR